MGNTILLADKSITIQKIVELTFSDDQYTIKCVNDGQSALDAIPQVRPDIILADISLPVVNGYELCMKLRNDPEYSEFSRVPVILLAGIYETMDEERAKAVELKVREVGANDLLSKPFDPQLLTTKVKDLMDGRATSAYEQPLETTEPPTEIIFAPAAAAEPPAPVEEFDYSEPPDDSEKTMMLPGPPVFSNTMFAEMPPFESESPDLEVQQTVKIESVTPAPEPVFEDAEFQALPESIPEYSPSETEELPVPDTSMFAGKEESEFSFDSAEEETFITRPQPLVESPLSVEPEPPSAMFEPSETPQPVDDSLFVLEEESKTAPQPALIVPPSEEPFGDVFDNNTPIENQWNASEEDSPFGLPEPPPAPPQPEPLAVEAQEPEMTEVAEPSSVDATGPIQVEPITELWGEAPAVAAAETASAEEDREELEELMGDAELKPDFGEDTWSRAKAMSGEQTVEELFEAEPAVLEESARLEEEEELEADLQDAEPAIDESVAEIQAVIPAAAPSPVQITEDMIDRIVEKVINKLSDRVVSDIVWQVVPDLAEKMIRRELEKLHAGEE